MTVWSILIKSNLHPVTLPIQTLSETGDGCCFLYDAWLQALASYVYCVCPVTAKFDLDRRIKLVGTRPGRQQYVLASGAGFCTGKQAARLQNG